MSSFVAHLESAIDGTRLPADRPQTTHADRPLWVRYDLQAIGKVLTKKKLKDREPTIWRYRELLPCDIDEEIISLGEGMTPLLQCPNLGARLGSNDLWIKDESQLPTGSFKSRGLVMAINMAHRFGIKRIAVPTAGNAGAATAAYAARAGMEAYVFMPEDTPSINRYETRLYGARTFLVNGLIADCGRIVREGKETMDWFDFSTLKEPYRIEGKKTMGLELAEQFSWELPDVILYPTGGGTGLIGIWKALEELGELGWLKGEKRPRMVAVQSDGCCPVVRAFESGKRFAEPFEGPKTIASGIRVPSAVGDFMILDTIRASEGRAVAVEEKRIREWMNLTISTEGISVCPETAACIGALELLISEGWMTPEERVVILNTAAAQKYIEIIALDLPQINKDKPIDWQRLGNSQ
jgi:threonine synthase